MATNKEPAFVALFDRFTPLTATFRTISRRHPREIPPAAIQPALYLEGRNRRPKQTKGVPAKWTVGALITIYCQTSQDLAIAPMTQINDLIQIVETALERKAGENGKLGSSRLQTDLGGLCEVCWISEDDPHGVVIFEGIQDGQGVIFIPVDMLNVG